MVAAPVTWFAVSAMHQIAATGETGIAHVPSAAIFLDLPEMAADWLTRAHQIALGP